MYIIIYATRTLASMHRVYARTLHNIYIHNTTTRVHKYSTTRSIYIILSARTITTTSY